MNRKIISAIFVCIGIVFIFASCRTAKSHAARPNTDEGNVETTKADVPKPNDDERKTELVEALRNIPVEGPSLGAPPVTALSTNEATEAVVREGRPIVPKLISALDHNSWTETVWIIFCLRELKATEARERILKLQREIDNGRFKNETHDFTLDVEIIRYLSVVGNKSSATGHERKATATPQAIGSQPIHTTPMETSQTSRHPPQMGRSCRINTTP